MKRTRFSGGFTLVEIMVATTVLLLVVGAAMSVFVAVNRSMYGLSDTIDLNARTRLTQERILLDLRAVVEVKRADLRAFRGRFVEYATGRDRWLELAFENSVLTRKLAETEGDLAAATPQVVIDNLQTAEVTATSRFLYRNRTGEKDVPAASTAEVRAIQIEFVPLPTVRQARGLVPGHNDPFSSALIQLRNVNG